MKATAKHKVVTSGRLTGSVKVQQARKQVTPKPGPSAYSEPAYSLYSTDSEDQVTTLHKGLDRCAALLSGILQADKAASPSPPRAVPGGGAKSRPSTSLGKKSIKKLPRKTVQKNAQSCSRGPGSTTPRTTPRSPVPAAHSGVKLHPPQKTPCSLLQSRKPQHLSPAVPPPHSQTSVFPSMVQSSPCSGQPPLHHTDCLSASEAPHTPSNAACDREEEELAPVRDIDVQSVATDAHAATRHALSHIHTCAVSDVMSNVHLEQGQVNKIPQETHGGAEVEVKATTVQYLLGELKALIAGQGSVAERLLSQLERTVSSPPMSIGSSQIQTESIPDPSALQSQNLQLLRHVEILNQQLKEKEKAERQQDVEPLSNSEVMTLQGQLISAQSRLQELQGDLSELRKALRDTQSQLRDKEAENAVIRTDLEAVRRRLVDTEREKTELESLAQQRLEEIENLNRLLQSLDSSDCPTVVDSSGSDAVPLKQQQCRQHPAEPPTERIAQYLMSLGQMDAKHTDVLSQECDHPVEMPARLQSSHQDQSGCLDEVRSCGRQLETHRRRLLDSRCDAESVSNWSVRSGSTFDTRDEAAFRDGLAALDASIASLQKTIQLDLRR
ncbi:coiled-coil domain-containing protein 14 [Toxotes jaculatrix]|uniref:coiled-coil domain-containing protein 14 n=1 Tax=Toxotes jaculatrix TaxID=941984 RepID=UPI001B3AA9B9|nr:coiled-coil domain-containing protein 14 [Toxotes jaculatrix]